MKQKKPSTSSSSCSTRCSWEFLYVDYHKGEHWYKCLECGKEDWFARYNLPNNKDP